MERAACHVCGRPTYDPDKRERPWARAVSGGRVALVCPTCQADRPEWKSSMDRCAVCGSIRLSVTLGEVVCRECGAVSALEARPDGQ
jgi:hypothetical protein